MMNSPTPTTMSPRNDLPAQLEQIGMRALPAELDDFLARATKGRWSPRVLLEQVVQAEIAERSRRSLERRLRLSGIKKFKPMADFEWTWPSQIERDVIERALTLDFLPEGRNLVLVGRNGLGKTMIAKISVTRPYWRAVRSCSVPRRRCWRNCSAKPRKAGTASYAAMPMSACCASMRWAIFLSTIKRPTYFMKSSTAAMSARA
jgi:hypothetical protein